jgi:hypothetical protein
MRRTFEYATASRLLKEAVALARQRTDLPPNWMDHARTLDVPGVPKTYTPFLITALLARAVDGAIDPYSIKADSGPHAYSARSLAHQHVIPLLKTERIGVRTTGREPLNNQPFFRYDRVDQIARVQRSKDFADFKSMLGEVTRLDSAQAKMALAAFLAARVELSAASEVPMPTAAVLSVVVPAEYDAFIRRRSEGGRRAQALAAAAFDLAFSDVRTSRVNDPSRHEPGDLAIFAGGRLQQVVEVRDKPMSQSDLQHFLDNALAYGCRRVTAVAVSARQEPLDPAALDAVRAKGQPCHISVTYSIEDLLDRVMTYSPLPPEEAWIEFGAAAARRLREVEASSATLREWNVVITDLAP